MSEDRFDRLFADLSAAHDGAEFHERVGEFGDLVAGEFADSLLVSRLAGSLGDRVELVVAGLPLSGVLREVGGDWCRISGGGPDPTDEAVVSLRALDSVRLRSTAQAGSSRVSVLSIASPLRGWAADRTECRIVYGAERQAADGKLDAVARDYVQLRRPGGRFELIPFSAIALVRCVRHS
ncbi:hypothetical protein GCM10022261_26740 [Brevibacterium daeguense]|uniref:Uncharacterized protein n=1 Tax=Brevibacterium daeguense TaxID=909936 RepID=A0ABP8EMH8_9MICO|nr:hypothetical protein [Brevibacterium daeguense]